VRAQVLADLASARPERGDELRHEAAGARFFLRANITSHPVRLGRAARRPLLCSHRRLPPTQGSYLLLRDHIEWTRAVPAQARAQPHEPAITPTHEPRRA